MERKMESSSDDYQCDYEYVSTVPGRDIDDDDDDDDILSIGSGEITQHVEPSNSTDSLEGQNMLTRKPHDDLRRRVFAVLLLAALLASVTTFLSVTNTELRNFHKAFSDASSIIQESVHGALERKLGVIDSLALDLSSSARSTTGWPSVTLPDFAMRGASTLDMAGGASVMLSPIVTRQTRSLWEDYTIVHKKWIGEGAKWENPNTSASTETFNLAGNATGPGPIASWWQSAPVHGQNETAKWVNFDMFNLENWKDSLHAWWIGEGSPTETFISREIFNLDGIAAGPGPFAPLWQSAPVHYQNETAKWVNFDMFSLDNWKDSLHACHKQQRAVFGEVTILPESWDNVGKRHTVAVKKREEPGQRTALNQLLKSFHKDGDALENAEPVSPLFYPVFNNRYDTGDSSTVVAILTTIMNWREFFTNSFLPPDAAGMIVVVHDSERDQAFTYQINGKSATYMGQGDLHDAKFDSLEKMINLPDRIENNETTKYRHHHYRTVGLDQSSFTYSMFLYPSKEMQQQYLTNLPLAYTTAVAAIFLFAALVFFTYDCVLERRQKLLMNQAQHSAAIVSSLFPETVRDRLFRGTEEPHSCDSTVMTSDVNSDRSSDITSLVEPAKLRLKSFLTDDIEEGDQNGPEVKPIADLFLNCTVLFADIAGFTAWSSLREPAQVFTLLEAVYQAFDRIARKRGVFKVETVGDSYVAVTGLPDAQKDHAVIMAKFARDARVKMRAVTSELELQLGPDTGDLFMRFGLHSGPVTAGVLRGERSRFQLFGDTVNTAARMESTGQKDRIQVSQATADLLIEAGKDKWLRKREELVHAKGKGELQTYWLEISKKRSSTGSQASCCSDDSNERPSQDSVDMNGSSAGQGTSALWGANEEIPEEFVNPKSKHQRLIDYIVDMLTQHLKRVVARRMVLATVARRASSSALPPNLERHALSIEGSTVLEEVTETIRLPSFDPKFFKAHIDPASVELDPAVTGQLKRYVTIIAAMYRSNPFHNFEHASHVTMSVNKLLQRVVQPDFTPKVPLDTRRGSLDKQIASELHDYTYGITSDPLTQFAVVFSALIHDVDHWGVSNEQLMKEGVPIAEKYKNKSIAEQNSVDLAWDLLMDTEEYGELQRCIFSNEGEYKRFRQVAVNVVMATDIQDKELGELRKKRWAKAFEETPQEAGPDQDNRDRMAMIVIEHIMQASDVAHTMQHWHVYQKWNRRLFDELYTAYKAGRASADPTTFWYKGELNFFDFYIIPLAKKLKDCGVFGVSSDECLNYAIGNRKEWEAKGQQLVAEMVASFDLREQEESKRPSQLGGRRRRQRRNRRRSLVTSSTGDW